MAGGVVGTLMTNLGLEKALAKMDIPLLRTNVGDRFVIEAMRKSKWFLGGETSGHVICSDLTSTGDGIVAALQVLSALKMSGQSLHEAVHGMSKCPQVVINVPLDARANLNHSSVKATVRAVESELAEYGRVVLRPSGTEPFVRVMVEGYDQELVMACAKRIAESVEKTA
jgi:phosphoglucosamine mutase